MLQEILKNIIKQINELIRTCLTYLFIKAIEKNKSFYAKLLLMLGANVNGINAKGDTALHIACRRQQKELFNILVNTPEININILNSNGNSAMHIADKHCFNDAVEKLLYLHMNDTRVEDAVATPPAQQLLLLNFNTVKRKTKSKEERKKLAKQVKINENPECHEITINMELQEIESKESKEMSRPIPSVLRQ